MSANTQRTTPTEGEVIDFPHAGAPSTQRRLSPKPQGLDWPLRMSADVNVHHSATDGEPARSQTTEFEPLVGSQPLFSPLAAPGPERPRFTMDDVPAGPAPRKRWPSIFRKGLCVAVLIATTAATIALFT